MSQVSQSSQRQKTCPLPAGDDGTAIYLTESLELDTHRSEHSVSCGLAHHLSRCCCGEVAMAQEDSKGVLLKCNLKTCCYHVSMIRCMDPEDGTSAGGRYDALSDMASLTMHMQNLPTPSISLCCGLQGKEYESLYSHGLQGSFTVTELMEGFGVYTMAIITRLPQFGARLRGIATQASSRSDRKSALEVLLQECGMVHSWFGDTCSVYSTLCHLETSTGKSCPSCNRLAKSKHIKLARKGSRTSTRITLLRELQAGGNIASGKEVDGTGKCWCACAIIYLHQAHLHHDSPTCGNASMQVLQ
jgi:hypothetical protein